MSISSSFLTNFRKDMQQPPTPGPSRQRPHLSLVCYPFGDIIHSRRFGFSIRAALETLVISERETYISTVCRQGTQVRNTLFLFFFGFLGFSTFESESEKCSVRLAAPQTTSKRRATKAAETRREHAGKHVRTARTPTTQSRPRQRPCQQPNPIPFGHVTSRLRRHL